MATFASAYAAKERHAKTMLKNPKIQGVGVGYLDPKNPRKGAAVIVYAETSSANTLELAASVSIPVGGKQSTVPIRVVKSKPIHSHANYRSRIRPVQAGYSIGTTAGSGTVGLIVTNSSNHNQRFIFSNNHVLTNPINSTTRVRTLQPGGADNGRSSRDRVGHLHRIVRLSRTRPNLMDAALSVPIRNSILSPRYAGFGVPPGYVTSYRVGQRLKKVGRTTGLTYGRVESVNTDVRVNYGSGLGTLTFRNQTIIRGTRPVSLPGDSGSVWLRREDNYAAAVNYAGTVDGRTSVAFPVDWAMRRFRTRTASSRGAGRIKVVAACRSNRAYSKRLSPKELSTIQVIRVRKNRN